MLNYKKVRGFLMLNYKKVRVLAVAGNEKSQKKEGAP